MKKSELKALLRAVESVRAELHPELDNSFVEAVVLAEQENFDDEGEAVRAIELALARLVKGGQ